jgi:hypothetical protein
VRVSQRPGHHADPDWPRWVNQPTDDSTGPVWCAADESGWNGDNLLDADDVIAHAVVRIDDHTAAPVLKDLREKARVRQPTEVKFKHFRRRSGLDVLVSAVSPGGPLNQRVSIAVADKKYAIVANMMNMLVEQRAYTRGENPHAHDSVRQMARTLYNNGRRALGGDWDLLLAEFVSLARVTNRNGDPRATVESFFRRCEDARWKCTRRNVENVLIAISDTRNQADWLVDALGRGELVLPPLDPLISLLGVSLQACSTYGPVRILHDQQKLFTPKVIESIFEGLQNRPVLRRPIPRVNVADFCMGDSSSHPSIQLADLMASAGRVVIDAQLGRPSSEADLLRDAVLPHIVEPWLLAFDGPWPSRLNRNHPAR